MTTGATEPGGLPVWTIGTRTGAGNPLPPPPLLPPPPFQHVEALAPAFVADPAIPEAAVAYAESWLRDRLAGHRLELLAIEPGSWRGRPGASRQDIVLGRLATTAANLLRGKHKPTYAPHMDMGDFVIIINADKVHLSGNKKTQKLAYRHSGYPGGLRSVRYDELLAKNPEKAIEKAIKGMIPKNTLGRQVL